MSIYPWDSGSGFGGLEDFLLRKMKEKRLYALLKEEEIQRFNKHAWVVRMQFCREGDACHVSAWLFNRFLHHRRLYATTASY